MLSLIFILMFMSILPSSIMGGEQEEKIICGLDIKRCREQMKGFGNGVPMLQWEIKTPDTGFNMWSFPDGVLIVSYGTKDDIIDSLIFYIAEDTSKENRFTMIFKVIEFYPVSKKMTLSLTDRR